MTFFLSCDKLIIIVKEKNFNRKKKKMPRKKEISFCNSTETWIGFMFIFFGLFLLFMIMGVMPFDHKESEIMPTGFKVVFSCFVFFLFVCGIESLMFSEDCECRYCRNKIYNFHKRIIVEWPETTKYSGKETWVREQMHFSCHWAAKEKFKIPDPKFVSLDI